MKKKIITAILVTGIFLLTYDMYAQDGVGGGSLIVGGQAAYTIGYLTPSNADAFDLRSGARVGVFVEERVTDFLAIGSGANMHLGGTNNMSVSQLFFDIEPITETATSIDLRLTKVEIPLYAAIYLGNLKAFAGGSWNLITKAEADITEELDGLKSINSMDVSKRLTKDEFALFIGAGFGINTGGIIVYPEIQYTVGFSDNNNVIAKSSLYHDYLSVGVKIGLDIF